MIEFINIKKSFGKLSVLDDFSVKLEKGHSVAIMGPNGSGKTTLIKVLLGMVIPQSGDLLFDGESVLKQFKYRNQIGYMPQISNYPPNLKIVQLFEMMKDIRQNNEWNGELDRELIDKFDLDSIAEKPLNTLSGGTKQKVSAALALLFNPEVIILDEPTAGLDPLAAEIFKTKILKQKAKGKLIIITSHIMADLEELTDYVLYMQDGKVQFFDELSRLRELTGKVSLIKIVANLLENKLYETAS